jgi:hypothetical protein
MVPAMSPASGNESTSRTGSDLVSTGVPGLDDILVGGLDANRLYLI